MIIMNRKRAFALSLFAILCIHCLVPGTTLADAEYYSIQELRENTPSKIENIYQTRWGTVEVSASIHLPTIDKLPALILRTIPSYDLVLMQGETNIWPPYTYASFSIRRNMESDFDMVPKGMTSSRQPWNKEYPENNSYSRQDAIELAKELVHRFTPLNLETDLTSLEYPRATGAYYLFDFNTGEIAEGHIRLDPSPTAVEKGSYIFSPKQCFYGAMLRGHGTCFYKYVPDEPVIYGSDIPLTIEIVDREHYRLSVFALAEEVELLADDIPLIGFDKVLETIESYIQAGHIRSISSIELCDLCVYASPNKDDPLTWAIPCWWVSGGWVDSPKDNITAQDLPENLMLCINAQTGEAYDPYDTSKDRRRLKQLITWDQVNK